jgi:hypothetical protein
MFASMPAGASALRSHVLDIGRTLGTVVSAALTRREALLAGQRLAAASLYTSLGTASWMADPPARDALDKVALVGSCWCVCSERSAVRLSLPVYCP